MLYQVEVWDNLVKYKVLDVDPLDKYCNSLPTKSPWELLIHVCPGFYWEGTEVFVRVTIFGPMGTGIETTTFELEGSFYQDACPLTIVTGSGWDPQQPGIWVTRAKYGQNNPTAGAWELDMGFGTTGNRDEKNHSWTSGTQEHFTVEYNGITHIATLSVTSNGGSGDSFASYNVGPEPANPCASITKIMIHAKSNTGGSVVIANLMLNGVSIGSPNSVTSTGDAISYLRITTDCYLTHFIVEGDFTFNWVTPSDERPAFIIYVEYS
jgi:hypothetical protein